MALPIIRSRNKRVSTTISGNLSILGIDFWSIFDFFFSGGNIRNWILSLGKKSRKSAQKNPKID